MNDTRFIELLNLFVDHQISPVEAEELERELTRSPVRQRTYRQYCRMQRASQSLFEGIQRQAPACDTLADALEQADAKVMAFRTSSLRRHSFWPLAGSALGGAAAVFAVVVWMTTRPVSMAPEARPMPTAAEAKPLHSSAESSVATLAPHVLPEAEVLALPAAYVLSPPTSSNMTNEGEAETWLLEVDLPPLRRVGETELALEPRSIEVKDTTLLRSREAAAANAEFIGFQFQR